jgi:hypothetical protein
MNPIPLRNDISITLKSVPDVSSARELTIQLVNESIAGCTEGVENLKEFFGGISVAGISL